MFIAAIWLEARASRRHDPAAHSGGRNQQGGAGFDHASTADDSR
ncbi:hypothetical protein [Rhodopseudomonas palustris]|nr:hypothetical protein [Rhodopseudomonas palustris]